MVRHYYSLTGVIINRTFIVTFWVTKNWDQLHLAPRWHEMIKSFKHKGLEKFFFKGTTKGIQPKHASRIADILDLLDAADSISVMKDRTRCPGHPGKILRNLYLEPLGLTITQLAVSLGMSRKAISAIVNERKSVTPEMALRLSQAFPNSTAESWLNLQKNYDLWQTAHRTDAWKTVQPVIDIAPEPSDRN